MFGIIVVIFFSLKEIKGSKIGKKNKFWHKPIFFIIFAIQ